MKNLRLVPLILFVLAGAVSGRELVHLMLATDYPGAVDNLDEYWVSEKLDGVRARWDGRRLVSRQGNVLSAPRWFTREFPPVVLDGELWMGRGTFAELSGAVRRDTPDADEWKTIRFMVFDAPNHGGPFGERLAHLRSLLNPSPSPYIGLIRQHRLANHDALMAKLEKVVEEGGEGLMLHHQDARYAAGRSNALMKLKPFRDADACVIGHIPGKGRLSGRLGSLVVETPEGQRFRLGTGFSDAERTEPPQPGSTVTYRHRGLTSKGLPRFPSFLRVRHRAGDPWHENRYENRHENWCEHARARAGPEDSPKDPSR